MTRTLLPWNSRGHGRLRVVGTSSIPGSGTSRVGDAEREDDRAAAVLAVGGDEDVAVLLRARGLPPASISKLHNAAFGEGGETALHLRARRDHVRPVHLARDRGAKLGIVGDQAVVVVPLVGAVGAVDGASGFVQESSRW
jgi:hypothetical protein